MSGLFEFPDFFEDKSELTLFKSSSKIYRKAPPQLLKWIGNKQRASSYIANIFPENYNRYFEPFLGSGAVLGAMGPQNAIAGDVLKPLIDMWVMLQDNPNKLYRHYKKLWEKYINNPEEIYNKVLNRFNKDQNPLDFVFLSRTCYGGVVRFTKQGKMSTRVGPHRAISPESFGNRIVLWRRRVKHTKFLHASYQETIAMAKIGDIIYCDPPYVDTQSILYGAQTFRLSDLLSQIIKAKSKGAKIALSIDGHKKSGTKIVELDIPIGLFERELLINNGSSMLKRFQKKDEAMIGEDVHDRLLLTW